MRYFVDFTKKEVILKRLYPFFMRYYIAPRDNKFFKRNNITFSRDYKSFSRDIFFLFRFNVKLFLLCRMNYRVWSTLLFKIGKFPFFNFILTENKFDIPPRQFNKLSFKGSLISEKKLRPELQTLMITMPSWKMY